MATDTQQENRDNRRIARIINFLGRKAAEQGGEFSLIRTKFKRGNEAVMLWQVKYVDAANNYGSQIAMDRVLDALLNVYKSVTQFYTDVQENERVE